MKSSEQQFCSPGTLPCTAQCEDCAQRSLRAYRDVQSMQVAAAANLVARQEWWARLRAEAAPSFRRLNPDDTEGGEA